MSGVVDVHYVWGGTLPSQLANSVQVMKMCEALTMNGHAVTLYHSTPGSDCWSSEEQSRVFAEYGIRYPFRLVNVPSGKGVYRHVFGVRVALKLFVSANKSLVFSRFLPAAAWCSLAGIATVHELHVPPTTLSERLYLQLLLAGKGFRKIVAITGALARALRRQVPERKWPDILIEADGVNLDEYRAPMVVPPDVAHLTESRPLVGYIGSLHSGKGAELIVRVARLSPDLQFLVVGGPDDLAESYRAQAKADGVTNISWVGFRQNVEVPGYVQACDVVLLPNQRSVVLLGKQDIGSWTSPLKLFEYMAAGKIILASDLPVLTEVLNSQNAVLCDPEDAAGWARELKRIADGEPGYAERAARARHDVKRYAWTERAARCLAAIKT